MAVAASVTKISSRILRSGSDVRTIPQRGQAQAAQLASTGGSDAYSWVERETARVEEIDTIQAARDLASFVAALQQVDPAGAPRGPKEARHAGDILLVGAGTDGRVAASMGGGAGGGEAAEVIDCFGAGRTAMRRGFE